VADASPFDFDDETQKAIESKTAHAKDLLADTPLPESHLSTQTQQSGEQSEISNDA